MADDEKKGAPDCNAGDQMVVGPDLGGVRPFVRHTADHRIESGLAKVHVPGTPVTASAVVLKYREANLFDVTPVSARGCSESPKNGPAKVSTEAYRKGWDNIFGNKTTIGQA